MAPSVQSLKKYSVTYFSNMLLSTIMVLLAVMGHNVRTFSDAHPKGASVEQTERVCDIVYDAIPAYIDPGCPSLTIQGGSLGLLTSTSFAHLATNVLTRLVISGNRISGIKTGTFANFTSLEYLDASSNDIQQLYNSNFQEMRILDTLLLHNNRIESLHNSAFLQLDNLRVLRLDENKLTGLNHNVLNPLRNLETLNLTQNAITEIASTAFEGNPKLQYLHIAYNYLTEIPETIMGDTVRKLHVLNLRSNFINTNLTSEFLQLDYLTELYLTNNDIPSIEENAFMYLRRLEVLHLDFNRLVTFGSWFDQSLQQLQEIKLDNNPWYCNCTEMEPWHLLRTREASMNLAVLEQNHTACDTPTARNGLLVFDFADVCAENLNDGGDGSTEIGLKIFGALVACVVLIVSLAFILCICYAKKKRVGSHRVSSGTAIANLARPDSHLQVPHPKSPRPPSPRSPTDSTTTTSSSTGNPEASPSGKHFPIPTQESNSHVYDYASVEILKRDPSYVNNKLIRLKMERSVGALISPHGATCKNDLDSGGYLTPIDKLNRVKDRSTAVV